MQNLSSSKSKSTSSLGEYESTNSLPENYHNFYDLIPALREPGTTNNNKHVVDLLAHLLQFDPRKRIKVEHIIEHPYCSRFRSKVDWRKMDRLIRVRYDNTKLSVDDYKMLLGNEIRSNPELHLALPHASKKKISPEKDKASKSIERGKQEARNSLHTPTQSPKVSPFHYASAINSSNTVNSDNRSHNSVSGNIAANMNKNDSQVQQVPTRDGSQGSLGIPG